MEFLKFAFFKIKWFLFSFWWLLLPLIGFYFFWELFTKAKREEFLKSLDWVLLEIKVPPEVSKTPKAMEQVFSNLHSTLRRKISFFKRNFKGVVQEWFSFEIVNFFGEIKFCVRTPSAFRNLIESQIYAQYPEAEINVVDDHFEKIEEKYLKEDYEFEDALLILSRENSYPILTYRFFEETKEEKRVDPLANILEAISTSNQNQAVVIQYLIRPVSDDWKKEGEEIVKKLGGGKPAVEMNIIDRIGEWIENFLRAFFESPRWSAGTAGQPPDFTKLSPGLIEIVKSVERKISKLGFEGVIRVAYFSKKEEFDKSKINTIVGSFFQFNSQYLNALKKEDPLKIKFKWFFGKRRLLLRKREEFFRCKKRAFPKTYSIFNPKTLTSIFNTEELATLYHFPTKAVKTPSLSRPSIKQIEPPPGLPT